MYEINEKLTFYYSQDAKMPALWLKGSWDVQFVKKKKKKIDVESFAIEDKRSMVVDGGCGPHTRSSTLEALLPSPASSCL